MKIEALLARAAADGASDVHLICGLPPQYRLAGALCSVPGETALTHDQCEETARFLAGERYDELLRVGELDLAATLADRRCRINLFSQQGHIFAALRLLAERIPPLENLGLPPKVETLTELRRGLFLVTGETGSGKSTTLAAFLDRINHTRPAHVLTLEDPIEYIYTPDCCAFNQREIGQDTGSYAAGLRAALREDPDILLIGELRDLDTIETALTAAETGHLVLATLHTASAADSVDRIVDVFPEARQRQIRLQLSQTLQAVLSQQLLPDKTGQARLAACELMVVTAAIRNLIREGKTPQIANAIATGAAEGAVTMDNAIIKLYKAGRITAETARLAAHDPDYLKKALVY